MLPVTEQCKAPDSLLLFLIMVFKKQKISFRKLIFRPAASGLSAVTVAHVRTRASELEAGFLEMPSVCSAAHLTSPKDFLPPNTTATHTDKAVPLNSIFENEFTSSESEITIEHRTTGLSRKKWDQEYLKPGNQPPPDI